MRLQQGNPPKHLCAERSKRKIVKWVTVCIPQPPPHYRTITITPAWMLIKTAVGKHHLKRSKKKRHRNGLQWYKEWHGYLRDYQIKKMKNDKQSEYFTEDFKI